MPSINEIRQNRIKKLGRIEKKGVAPYPAKTKRTHTCREALERFEEISSKREKIFLAGRLMTVREHGGSTFAMFRTAPVGFRPILKKTNWAKKRIGSF